MESSCWYAVRTRQEQRAEAQFLEECEEVLSLRETVKVPGKRSRSRSLIPHVLFVKTTRANILDMEKRGREHPESNVSFWIYRYPKDNEIQIIHPKSVELLRLLTAEDTEKCEIYNNTEFKANQKVRVTGGQFADYEGYVVRVKKNKHVVVKIEGVCLVMLPFIHPNLLQVVES